MLEFHMEQVAKGLGHKAQFAVFPNYTLVAFDREEYPALGSQTLFFSTTSGLDMYKLHLVDELARRVASYGSPLPPIGSKLPPDMLHHHDFAGVAEGDFPGYVGSVRAGRRLRPRSRIGRFASMLTMSGALDRAAGGIGSIDPTPNPKHFGSRARLRRASSLQRMLNGESEREGSGDEDERGADGDGQHDEEENRGRERQRTFQSPSRYSDLEQGGSASGGNGSSSTSSDDEESMEENLKRWILNLASYGPGFWTQKSAPSSSKKTTNAKAGVNEPADSDAYDVTDDPSEPLLHNKELEEVVSAATEKSKLSASMAGAIGAAVAAAVDGQVGKVELNASDAAKAQAAAFEYIAVEDAMKRLKQIVALPDLHPPWAQHLLAGVATGAQAGLFFNGGWVDVGVAAVLGAFVGFLGDFCEGQHTLDKIYEFMGAVIISFVTRTLIHFDVPLCYSATTLSSVINLVQGVTITLAMVELATKNVVSGTTRLAYGLTMTGIIGY
ncbi:hypothetical protein HK104_006841, partial [Borealophlyctis nickersoniae]